MVENCPKVDWSVTKLRKWLELYGELLSDITEDHHHDPDPKSQKVGNGIIAYNLAAVQMASK